MTALNGLKIIDLSRLYPGPFASMILADYGAEVICVESPEYKNNPPHIHSIYRNKKHISLDLKKNQGKEAFLKLTSSADVLIEGFRPGVTEKLGIDYQKLKKINKRLIYTSITGYGQTGPYFDKPGHDVNYLAESGVLDLIGKKGSSPVIPGIQIADSAGAMYSVTSILTALYERERSGKGQYIDISITESVLSFASLSLYFSNILGERQKRGDMILAHRYPFYDIYETKDKRFLAVGCLEFHFWKNLCNALDLEDYINFQFDDSKKEVIRERLKNIFLTKSSLEWDDFFNDKNVCVSIVKTLDEAKESLLFKERESFSKINTENGLMDVPGITAKLSETSGKIVSDPPSFGENTEEILFKLGYLKNEIRDFKKSGVI
jgi:crotonobetainyl-CoA:carnitine CoA-transferase CaiB-like acyl-CoA transferase